MSLTSRPVATATVTGGSSWISAVNGPPSDPPGFGGKVYVTISMTTSAGGDTPPLASSTEIFKLSMVTSWLKKNLIETALLFLLGYALVDENNQPTYGR